MTIEVLEAFLERLIGARTRMVQEAGSLSGMWFYLWFDEQACQLRFSSISALHAKLPFKAEIRQLDDPRPVLEAFVASLHHQGIQWDELEPATLDEPEGEAGPLPVFVTRLPGVS